MPPRERRDRRDTRTPEEKEFQQRVVDLRRVTRVTKGGKRLRFRATVLIGDGKGRIGFGVGKGADVALSTGKAFRKARQNLTTIPLKNETVPHIARAKFGSATVLIKPAPKGTGVKAGGPMRIIFELAGVSNVVGKILGTTKNKINIIKATLVAIEQLR
ncbi:30S ribosomal protein S5 [Candidatus Uhrbacteria bacterium RIFCSPLOWO2_01_FULL_47_24]|uniref:Small ribosomal subunit protein uS5 n=1 Tax=Candidatus Uhrbacteria bacterium RIFCSPLOWO2_01_FULL_47_24 TaxID=1802401 RepID=A0A1F7UTM5_9BACT|nr:MAG: 30S ribosomal protein S5 [Candidatus Uhrbacteria bacterium RIFCSPHIGHO2_01_FULL_47_11]OGL68964.1 MAG: 30S ribosomal protein S5 [Candidatus Uhrbacteria bacterium RIFCSPHIGHO2_02_FULL_46_47]OGL74919.1 MAG: 30S ribosomal protein S5 [Candidatus Uhrbacteria bacterium RIFCSPHIGHO2_12_FULL_47_11]OGL81660.1 MAG: 30S ribosomal protein S5 [Candidatus Uhrbacteria bacterium RIFCSPLOWO2_01_FULL_47_24]OGL85087.1 MAG: 30S ribosomal protein S5 [Candidatus Uhrbacteria bacterium RIFCSPLOWO2_02_FULL_46_25